ncbi:MAG: hypothetical protein GY793_02795 [Proteobacteria bacterium]|nr:hypothetical protein [Pseudomonadota bacterium]
MALPKTEEKQMTIYTCKYCRKYYKRKKAAEWHQYHCSSNPRNNHICFHDCEHLKYTKADHETEGHGIYSETTVSPATFYCKKHNKYMYSYIAERKKIIESYGEDLGERMPLRCGEHQYQGMLLI